MGEGQAEAACKGMPVESGDSRYRESQEACEEDVEDFGEEEGRLECLHEVKAWTEA